MDSPPQIAASLEPRLRRLLTFGDVLDESMLLFRRHWLTFATVSSVSLLPPGLILVWLSGSGVIYRSFSLADLQTGRLANPAAVNAQTTAQLAASAAYFVVYVLFDLLWSAAIVLTTDAYLRGEQPSLARVYRRATPRYFVLLLSTLLITVGVLLCTLLASVLFVVTGFGIAGSLIAIVGLLFWWLKASTRRSWLKWLIILTAPFGLTMYVATRWGMYLGAAVLEHKGPVAALHRSMELTTRHWFRVFAILMVATLIIQVMLSVLNALVTVPFTIVELFKGQLGLNPTEAAISSAVSVVVQILVASIASIVYTVLFVDLRNRREGTDIGERVRQLEQSPVPANG